MASLREIEAEDRAVLVAAITAYDVIEATITKVVAASPNVLPWHGGHILKGILDTARRERVRYTYLLGHLDGRQPFHADPIIGAPLT